MERKRMEVSWIDWPEEITYEPGEVVFEDWEIRERLGKGAHGMVFRIGKELMGVEQSAAMKVVHIEPDDSMDDMLRAMGQSDAAIASRHRDELGQVMREILVMMSLRNHPNVVRCEDFRIFRIGGENRWDIQIRMELLTPLQERMRRGLLSEAEVIRLGREICGALVACEEKGLIHRDVKPANIFLDERGSGRLGDFGTARMQSAGSTMTQKAGTELYMAPEVLRGGHYDQRVDIYSLGVVLYQLANGNRMPFYPEPERITARSKEEAFNRRMGGEALPAPDHASPALAQAILTACAFDPEKRFATAQDFLTALEQAERGGTPTSTEAPSSRPEQAAKAPALKAGDTVTFGHYPQNADGKDKTPIEWQVLETDGRTARLISVFALDVKPYHETYEAVGWAQCTLRAWLNGPFRQAAFTAEESARLLPADGGDAVSLMSAEEAERFFPEPGERACNPTAWARAQGANAGPDGRGCWRWLRQEERRRDFKACVRPDGSVTADPVRLPEDDICVSDDGNAVRPVILLRLET